MGGVYERRGMGWLPDYPDFRDYSPDHNEVAPALKAASLDSKPKKTLPAEVDLRAFCSPIEDQGSIGSCTANATIAALEYFERRAHDKHIDASRLFLYKTTRNMLHWTGDTGAFLRTAMGALVLFGAPPEEYWPYNVDDFEEEPPAFCYAFAENFKAIKYVRLDPVGTTPDEALARVKTYLAGGFPSTFGFTVYNSIFDVGNDGKIPMPKDREKSVGGHAILAVGYDDKMKITHKKKTTTGALIIRNSWGKLWGDKGYGYMPYDYVLSELADDWWTLSKADWVDTGQFGS